MRAISNPVGQRDEGIVGPGHDDAVFAALLDAIAQRQPKSQHQVLFAFGPDLGAVVDAAMAGIDHDHGAQIRRRCGLGHSGRGGGSDVRGIRDGGPQFGPAFRPKRLNKDGAVDLLQFKHQPRRLAVGGVEHVGVCDLGRAGQIEHDPRTARHHQAIAERLDQPASGGAGACGKLKIDLGDIHDHPIGIGQGEGAKLNGLVEIEDEAGLLAVAGQADVGGDREVRRSDRCRARRATGATANCSSAATLVRTDPAHGNAAAHTSAHLSKTR